LFTPSEVENLEGSTVDGHRLKCIVVDGLESLEVEVEEERHVHTDVCDRF
jgi:hypothetical protein